MPMPQLPSENELIIPREEDISYRSNKVYQGKTTGFIRRIRFPDIIKTDFTVLQPEM
jgi:hypothetical protein